MTVVLLLSTMFVGFNACSDDDDDNNKGGELSSIIVGTWEVTAWESDESGSEESIGTQFTFKKDGFVDFGTVKDVAKWSILKKGTTYDEETYGNTVLKYDALLLTFLTAEDKGDKTVFLIKEYTANTVQVSILDFELENDPNIYSRGTLKKVK